MLLCVCARGSVEIVPGSGSSTTHVYGAACPTPRVGPRKDIIAADAICSRHPTLQPSCPCKRIVANPVRLHGGCCGAFGDKRWPGKCSGVVAQQDILEVASGSIVTYMMLQNIS